MVKILLIEPDNLVAGILIQQLSNIGVNCCWRHNFAAGVIESMHVNYSLIIVNCANHEGIQAVKRIKNREIPTPVLAMIQGFTDAVISSVTLAGADSFLSLPYKFEQLKTKISALLKHNLVSGEVLALGEICIYKQKREVSYLNKKIELKRREFDILLLLAENKGKVLRRTLLNDATTLHSRNVTDATVDVHVSKIRTKLKIAGLNGNLIDTVYGVGYRLT